MSRLLVAFCLLLALAGAAADASTGTPANTPAWTDAEARTVRLWFFWTEHCPHCREARPFIESLPQRFPWIEVASHDVSRDAAGRALFERLAGEVGADVTSVPSFIWCGRGFAGFDHAEGVGHQLVGALAHCYAEAFGEAPPGVRFTTAPPAEPPLPALPGGLDATTLSLPVLTLVLASLDAFNPCAFFVLLFLLSMLVHTRSRARMLLIGGLFLSVSGLVYFLFMAAWLNLFLLVGHLRAITVVAGLVALFIAVVNVKEWFAFKRGVTLTLTDSQEHRLFARMRGLLRADSLPLMIVGTIVLALMANAYELLCTAGFPMVYTRILTLHGLAPLEYYLWLALYNVVYVLPLMLITGAFVITLGARRLSEREGRALKLVSGLMMLGLGSVLLIAPALLNRLATALILLAFAVTLTLLMVWWDRRHPVS
ncbi:MAG: thioredoxin family protein [Chromatiales bacterium]|nr:thioredoxin family protein [Chromatiales bacterium]MDX9766941.1 thioredoxin family protein [Ectothiorhodospiraceae bacterium]